MKLLNQTLSDKKISVAEYTLIVITALIPLLFQHPYRINLFLAWEGAYRVSTGEIPYRDFGSPVGYGFWLLPALFFKIFGPYVYTLLVVQAFINIFSGFIFRGLLSIFKVPAPVRLMALVVYCLSYSMFNFWPWYNHLVFVVEIAGLYYLCSELVKPVFSRKTFRLVLGAFFVAFSFMTKQDTGALAFGIALALLAYDAVIEKKLRTSLLFVGSYLVWMTLMIVPFLQFEFTYWFNLGQFPHYGRADKFDIVNEFLGGSDTIKLYLFFIVVIIILKLREVGSIRADKNYFLLALFVLCILGQATIIQVTSYTPIDGNIYFHSFAFAFVMYYFSRYMDAARVWQLSVFVLLICIWWSNVFWSRFLKERFQQVLAGDRSKREHVISKRTYLLSADTMKSNRSRWIVPDVKSFKRVRIPESTEEGIHKIAELPEMKKTGVKVLNMTELTPLVYDLGYALERGPAHPLWYHKGVAFFDREVVSFCGKITRGEYDVIMFEDIPNVNQFYPYEVRDCIREHYTLQFKFLAPRVPEFCYIEVYTKRKL
jgi:hypothetical protein